MHTNLQGFTRVRVVITSSLQTTQYIMVSRKSLGTGLRKPNDWNLLSRSRTKIDPRNNESEASQA